VSDSYSSLGKECPGNVSGAFYFWVRNVKAQYRQQALWKAKVAGFMLCIFRGHMVTERERVPHKRGQPVPLLLLLRLILFIADNCSLLKLQSRGYNSFWVFCNSARLLDIY